MTQKELVVKRLQNALKMNLYGQIRTIFPSIHPENQAKLLESIDSSERKKLCYVLGDRIKPHLLIKLPQKLRYEIISYLDERQLATITTKLLAKDAVVEDLELEIKLLENQKDSVFNTIISSVFQRSLWLVVAIFLTAASSLIADSFDNVMHEFVILAVIIPVISNVASIAEAQTVTILVRDLGRIENLLKDWKQIITKETIIGFLQGLILGVIIGLILFFWKSNYKLGVCAFLSVLVIQTLSCFLAASITLGTEKMKLDPALVSDMVATASVVAVSYYVLLKFGILFLR